MRIGHASIGETGARNQIAGDQTKKECCERQWYANDWKLVLRPKDSSIAEKIAKACEDGCKNNHIGYDQNQRNTLKSAAVTVGYDLSRITKDCECDCSSFMTVCCECAGIPVAYNSGNAPTTSTMKIAFMNTGYFELLTDAKYLNDSKYLKRGDILVKPGVHTVMVLDNGSVSNQMPEKVYQYGVDVSEYQGKIDWAKVKAAGKTFAVLRIATEDLMVDKTFEYNLTQLKNNKMDYSCYKEAYALSEEEAVREADAVLNILHGRQMTIWYALEMKAMRKLDKAKIEKIVMAFIRECNLKGYQVGIYTNNDWYLNVISDLLKKNYMFWIARYGKNDGTLNMNYPPAGDCFCFQYTDKGRVPGINTNVDLDVIL